MNVDDADLKEFTKITLGALCSNPVVMDPSFQKQIRGQGVTTESMAVGIAYTALVQMQATIDKKKEKGADDDGAKIISLNP